jgi:hypothetical protein
MDRQQSSSSNMASVGYDASLKLLEIEFRSNGSVYQYENVTPHEYNQLLSQGGKYLKTHIEKSHPFRRVD